VAPGNSGKSCESGGANERYFIRLSCFTRINSSPFITAAQIADDFNKLLIAGGCGMLLGLDTLPDSIRFAGWFVNSNVSLFPYFVLAWARSFFQPSAEALLANDKRPAVLLLRSFKDKEIVNYRRGDASFVDYSLEARIAEHFYKTGPFITVGSIQGGEIAIGAARAKFSDAEWQPKVLDWIDSAALIIVMAGATTWIQWELKQVVQRGHTKKLILSFPQFKKSMFSNDPGTMTARMEGVISAFQGTPWEPQLLQMSQLLLAEHIRGVIFEANGRLTAVTAWSRNRNTYHLGILISHFLLTKEASDGKNM
jgi:hypothetical protein